MTETNPTLGRRIVQWTQRVVLGIVALCALVYVGDFVLFLLRGKPQGQVQVTNYMAAPEKDSKTELYFEGSGPMSCARALFPQSGLTPCWYLSRHPLYAEKP